jgi:hypothetical protein
MTRSKVGICQTPFPIEVNMHLHISIDNLALFMYSWDSMLFYRRSCNISWSLLRHKMLWRPLSHLTTIDEHVIVVVVQSSSLLLGKFPHITLIKFGCDILPQLFTFLNVFRCFLLLLSNFFINKCIPCIFNSGGLSKRLMSLHGWHL